MQNLEYGPLPEIYIKPKQMKIVEPPVSQPPMQKMKQIEVSNPEILKMGKLRVKPKFAAENSYLLRAVIWISTDFNKKEEQKV